MPVIFKKFLMMCECDFTITFISEAEFAVRKQTHIIVLSMDSGYNADGWLKKLIRSKPIYDIGQNENNIEAVLTTLLHQLNQRISPDAIPFDVRISVASTTSSIRSSKIKMFKERVDITHTVPVRPLTDASGVLNMINKPRVTPYCNTIDIKKLQSSDISVDPCDRSATSWSPSESTADSGQASATVGRFDSDISLSFRNSEVDVQADENGQISFSSDTVKSFTRGSSAASDKSNKNTYSLGHKITLQSDGVNIFTDEGTQRSSHKTLEETFSSLPYERKEALIARRTVGSYSGSVMSGDIITDRDVDHKDVDFSMRTTSCGGSGIQSLAPAASRHSIVEQKSAERVS